LWLGGVPHRPRRCDARRMSLAMFFVGTLAAFAAAVVAVAYAIARR
jgi:hypothetical protein